MTRYILVTSLCALSLVGCGRTVVRETVVERPVVRETVVERPAVAVTTPASCNLAGAGYIHGSLSCQAGYQYQCSNGVWERIPGSC